MYGNGFCGNGFGFGMGMGHGAWLLLCLGLVMLTLVLWFSRPRNPRPETALIMNDEALVLLRRRYAAGELTSDEFQVMKNKLQE